MISSPLLCNISLCLNDGQTDLIPRVVISLFMLFCCVLFAVRQWFLYSALRMNQSGLRAALPEYWLKEALDCLRDRHVSSWKSRSSSTHIIFIDGSEITRRGMTADEMSMDLTFFRVSHDLAALQKYWNITIIHWSMNHRCFCMCLSCMFRGQRSHTQRRNQWMSFDPI